jgi:GT2 family glycosyltransferase
MDLDLTGSIVLYHNNPTVLKEAIQSFLNTSLNVRLYLIDNSKNDALRQITIDPRVFYHYTGANLGFGKGHNIALSKALDLSPYHLILNPDVTFPHGTCEMLYAYMEQSPDIGLVMPKVINSEGGLQFMCKRLPTPSDLFLRRFMPEFLYFTLTKRMFYYEMRDKDYSKPFQAPSLSGCFMFVRTEALKAIGLFDDRFFMYMEDTDLCRRMMEKYKTMYYPGVSIYHGHARESYRFNRLFLIHIYSAFKYFNKWGWLHDSGRTKLNASV